MKKEFDEYKESVKSESVKRAKTEAYESLLREAGVSEKRIKSVLKVADTDSIEFDNDGKVKNSEEKIKSIQSEWADFIVTETVKGADTANPATNVSGKRTKEEILAITDTVARQQAMAEQPELFGI